MLFLFDTINTVFKVKGVVSQASLDEYAQHLRDFRDTRVWKPLSFPQEWNYLDAFNDVAPGVSLLRAKGHTCVTLSNMPAGLQARLNRHSGIGWDGIVPLEAAQVYKTDLRTYIFALQLWQTRPEHAVMVTANKTFGDLEAAATLGIRPVLIRDISGIGQHEFYHDILNLAEKGKFRSQLIS